MGSSLREGRERNSATNVLVGESSVAEEGCKLQGKFVSSDVVLF